MDEKPISAKIGEFDRPEPLAISIFDKDVAFFTTLPWKEPQFNSER